MLKRVFALIVFGLVLLLGQAGQVAAAPGAVFTVNRLTDNNDANLADNRCDTRPGTAGDQCTLRAAVQQANATPGTDTINLASNAVHTLTRSGDDNAAAVGDLDITEAVNIVGHSHSSTIDSDVSGSVFEVFGAHTASFENLVILGGFGDRSVKGNAGALSFKKVTLSQNNTAAVFCSCLVTFDESIVQNMSGISATRVDVRDSSILGQGGGTGVSVTSGDSTIARSAIRGHFRGVGNFGGTLVIRDSEISDNRGASFDIDVGLFSGGGITNEATSATTVIVNSTLSGNGSLRGGAITVLGGTFRLFNVTVANNFTMEACDIVVTCVQGESGGIWGTVELTNSIIANNQNLFNNIPDCFGTLVSNGFNLIGNTTGCTINGSTTGNKLNLNLVLGSLANNGGPTKTHKVLARSPVIDAGNPNGCKDQNNVNLFTDQRGTGFPRHTDGDGDGTIRCEMGAFEVGAVGIGSVSPKKGNSDPGELVVFDLAWDSPTRWRDLDTLDLRFKRKKEILLWLRFTEGLPTSTISLLDEDGNVVDSGNVGEQRILKNEFGSVSLAQSGFTASGPDDPHVVVHYAVTFRARAEGKLRIEMLATDDFPNQQGPEPAGKRKVNTPP